MNTSHLWRLIASVVLVALIAGCGAANERSAQPSASPSATASTEPSVEASASPTSAAACKVPTTSFAPLSDQLVSMKVSSVGATDRVVFTFGAKSGQPVTPHGRLRAVRPPFTEVASGKKVTVRGKRFVEVGFSGMYLFDRNGNDAFQGELDRHPKLTAVRDIISIDSFEGHMTWVVGYNGGGCVTIHSNRTARTLTIQFDHS
jgi:hypothetical protein